MHHDDLSQRIETAMNALLEAPELTDLLRILRETSREIDGRIIVIANPGAKNEAEASHIHNLLGSLGKHVRQKNARQIFKEIESTQLKLALALTQDLDDVGNYRTLSVELESLAERYNEFITVQNPLNAFHLIRTGEIVERSFESLKQMLVFVKHNILEEPLPNERQDTMSLVIFNRPSAENISKWCSALADIYAEVARLIDVSVSDFPLEVVRVETGSTWFKVIGESGVLAFVKHFIKGALVFMRRHFVEEGRLAEIPAKVGAIDKILDLSLKLKEAGLSTARIDSEIEKAALTIAKSVNDILAEQTKIIVDGAVIEVAQPLLEIRHERNLSIGRGVASAPPALPPPENGKQSQ